MAARNRLIADADHFRRLLTRKRSSLAETYSKIKSGIGFKMQKEGLKERQMEIKGLGTLGALDIYFTDAHHDRCSLNREISSFSGAYSQKSDKIETKMHSRDTEYEGRG